MKLVYIAFILIILSFSITGELYSAYADREFGFWAVRAENTSNNSHFVNKTLSISTGDTVRFVNMDGNDDRITIISDNNLWEGGAVLSGTGKRFDFTFNSSGYYRFHIVERSHIDLNASNFTDNHTNPGTLNCWYNAEDDIDFCSDSSNTADYLKAVTDIETFQYQSILIKVSGKTIGNGTVPIKSGNVTRTIIQSGYNYTSGRQTVSVNASPKPKTTTAVAAIENATSSPLPESYQEFTLYEMFKRWYMILKGG